MSKYQENDIGFGPALGPQRDAAAAAAALAAGTPGARIPGPGGGVVSTWPTDANLTIPSLTLTTDTYFSDITGHLVADVKAVWTQPIQPENPNDPNGIKAYFIDYAILGVSRGWSSAGNVHLNHSATINNMPVGVDVLVRVQAETTKGHLGPWTTATITTVANSTPPPVPSAPTVIGTLRGASVQWDGLNAAGAARPSDWKYVEAQISLDPTMATGVVVAGTLSGAGFTAVTPIGTAPFTVYARLRAMNTSHVYSDYSAIVSGTSITVVPEDVGQGAITTKALATGAVDANAIAQNAVTAFGISDSAITVNKLADLAVVTGKIANDAISSIKLAAGAVVARNIVDGSVVTAALADNAVTQQKVQDAAIVTSKISDNAVSNLKLIDGGVSTSKIAGQAITSDLLAQFAVTAQKVGFGIGGGNLLLNSNYANRGDPATPLPPASVPHWAVDSACDMQVVTSSVAPGTLALEITYDPVVGQQPALH